MPIALNENAIDPVPDLALAADSGSNVVSSGTEYRFGALEAFVDSIDDLISGGHGNWLIGNGAGLDHADSAEWFDETASSGSVLSAAASGFASSILPAPASPPQDVSGAATASFVLPMQSAAPAVAVSPVPESSAGLETFVNDPTASSSIDTGLADYVTSGGKWGPSGTFGTTGGVVTWSIVGAGWGNASGDLSWFSGKTVDLSSFLNFDYTSVIQQAFNAWSAVANITFQMVPDGGGNMGTGSTAMIRISGAFIDGEPNGSDTLAATFYPVTDGNAQNVAISGDMAIDSGDTSFWTTSSLLAVVTHELGHALGLEHTPVPNSIMDPIYNPSITTPQSDDIAGIRAIYGPASSGPIAGSVTINDVAIIEGNSGTQMATFTVTRSGGTAAFSVNFATADNTATAGSDYVATAGTLNFASGVDTRTISVTINDDTTVEQTESFYVNLSNATNGAAIADNRGIGTILNDDVAVVGSVSINDVAISEGDTGTQHAIFTVTRTGGTAAFAVNFSTADNTASAGGDYVATSGTLNFASGVNTKTISVTINGDTTVEQAETFFVNLTNITNGGTLTDAQGIGTILNNEIHDDYADSLADHTAPIGTVSVDGVASGTIETLGDRDWFQVQLTAGKSYVIDLQSWNSAGPGLGDPFLRIHGSNGGLLASDDDSGGNLNSEVVFTPTSTGTYYIEAGAFADSSTGLYSIAVSTAVTPLMFTNSQDLIAGDQQAQALYVAYFQRAGDPSGVDWWTSNLNSGQTIDQVALNFAKSPEAHHAYTFLGATTTATDVDRVAFINSIYHDLFNRNADSDGLRYWDNELTHDQTTLSGDAFANAVASFILEVIRGAQNTSAGQDITTMQNKIEVATYFTQQLNLHGIAYANNLPTAVDDEAHLVIKGTDTTSASVTTQEAAIDTYFNAAPLTTVGIVDQHAGT